MPRAPKSCARCDTKVIGRTYCDDCKPNTWPKGASRTSTAEHQAWRRDVLARDKGSCQIRGPRCIGRATHADHLTPVAEGGAEYDLDNGQAACEPCHKVKSLAEATRGRQRAAQRG